MRTPPPEANDNARRSKKEIHANATRCHFAMDASTVAPPCRWRRVRRAVAWVGGALVVLAAVGTAVVVVHDENRTVSAPVALAMPFSRVTPTRTQLSPPARPSKKVCA